MGVRRSALQNLQTLIGDRCPSQCAEICTAKARAAPSFRLLSEKQGHTTPLACAVRQTMHGRQVKMPSAISSRE
eukprot:1591146-Pleurochrysis_carterae.AAC.2